MYAAVLFALIRTSTLYVVVDIHCQTLHELINHGFMIDEIYLSNFFYLFIYKYYRIYKYTKLIFVAFWILYN